MKLKKAENILSTYVKMFEWSGVLYVFTLNIFPGFCAYKGDQDTDPSPDVLREAEDMWDPSGRAETGFCHKTRVLSFPRSGEFFNAYWFVVSIIQFSVTLTNVVFKETVIYDGMWDAFSRSRVSLVIKLQGGESTDVFFVPALAEVQGLFCYQRERWSVGYVSLCTFWNSLLVRNAITFSCDNFDLHKRSSEYFRKQLLSSRFLTGNHK